MNDMNTQSLLKQALERMGQFFDKYRDQYSELGSFIDLVHQQEQERLVETYKLLGNPKVPMGYSMIAMMFVAEVNKNNFEAAVAAIKESKLRRLFEDEQ